MRRTSTVSVSNGVGRISEIEQFESRIASIGEILSGENFYAIPDMQRDYQWDIESGDQHGLNLWRSITEFVDEDPNQEDCYYLGTMIKYIEDDIWMVVDGQQRLTTLSLLFMTIRDALDMAAANGTVGEIGFQNETYDMEGIGRAIAEVTVGFPNQPKLTPKEASLANYKAFMGYLHPLGNRPAFQTKRRHKYRVVQAYDMFVNKIEDRFGLTDLDGAKALVSFTEHILSGLAINLTIVKDLAQGYRIFSSENTTGLKLGNLDILRALVLAHCDRKKFELSVLEKVKQHLADMMANLVELSKGEKEAFVRHYWIMQTGIPMPKSKLVNTISHDIRSILEPKEMIRFVRKIKLYSLHYSDDVIDIREDQLYFESHRYLANCSFKQYRPFLLGLSSRKDMTKNMYKKIFHLVETLYVRFLLIGRQKGSILEPIFAKWAAEAMTRETNITVLFETWLSDAAAIKESFDFLNAFTVASISDKKIHFLLTRIEDLSEQITTELRWNSVVEPIVPIVKEYDHWAAAWGAFTNLEFAEGIQHRIGNYVLSREKSKFNHASSFSEKKEHYLNTSFYSITKNVFNNNNSWNKQKINQATRSLAAKAEEYWNLNQMM